jgi:membrane protein insertase Oxa1/YidC/SpoIIIJ
MLMILIQLPLFISFFTAINVVARPRDNYNVDHSAYSFVKQIPRVNDLIGMQNKYFDDIKANNEKPDDQKTEVKYEFQPKLFNIVDLSTTAGFTSKSSVVILIFALLSALTQFIMARQQDPSRKSGKKKRGFREIMKDAAAGKEADQSEINAVAQGQMTWMMPLMMLMIMMNLPGALVLYYLLNNIITVALQKVILNRDYTEMEAAADKRILKELKDAQEAVIVEDNTKTAETKKTTHYTSNNKNKNEKAHITRISASNKKKRR